MLTVTVEQLDRLIVDNLHAIRAIPFDIVVHIPRSGTIPASLIATYLCKPLASVDEYCRGILSFRKSRYDSKHRILLVDDSIRTGKQMLKYIDKIKRHRPGTEIYTLAAFSTQYPREIQPDIKLYEHAEVMYIYPWFMWKTERIERCAVDMDGVLCRDCTPEEDDDGERYLEFIKGANPKFIPLQHKIGAIITSRLEKYRAPTEKWLQKHGIEYGTLIMGVWETKQERKGKQAEFKAMHYQGGPWELYIESSAKEAPAIAEQSGKPVWCVDLGRAFP